ncbi:MAG: phosphatase PAP2 family protein [Gammaproteobacteria bacterium]|nr:phosphatase PAP2 family protein [Gammaproteobacteria bacterium]
MRPARALAVFAIAATTAAVAVAWVDRALALMIAAWLPPGVDVPMNVPDLLLEFVVAVTLASFLVWVWIRWRGGFPRLQRIAPLLGIVAPLSLALKFIAKWVFGRTQSRWFIDHPGSYSFHWFDGQGVHLGFPSGHMLVATAVVLVVLAVFPRLRFIGWLALIALAVALLLTSYHYLGDLIAGWLLGAALAWVILAADARLRPAENARTPS